MPRAFISLFIKLHSMAGRQQGEQSGTAQQHWQGACGVRGTILCEPERRCQGQGGVGSEEDRAGKWSNTDENAVCTLGNRPGASWGYGGLLSSGESERRMTVLGLTKSPVGAEGGKQDQHLESRGHTEGGSRGMASNRFPGHSQEAEFPHASQL